MKKLAHRLLLPIYPVQPKRTLWQGLFTLTIASAYFYVAMEWLFFVTKPSFMDLMGWGEKLEILLESGFAAAILSGILLLVFAGLDLVVSRFRSSVLPVFIGSLIPTAIITVVSLLLVDNFTYTVFRFGIVSTGGILRGAYGLGFLVLFIYINSRILAALGLRVEPDAHSLALRTPFLLAGSLLTISALLILVRIGTSYFGNGTTTDLQRSADLATRRPNILLLGGDGLSAAHLSVYGYERDTTPTLRKLASSSLLAENAFSNAAHSAGSVISILTSKLPTQTRVLYPPDILNGVDAYQHLPGILRTAGYHTVEIGVPNFVDAYQMNLQDGFDRVNQRSLEESAIFQFPRSLGIDNSGYFASQLVERAKDRLLHIFFIKKMENPYAIVTQSVNVESEREQINQLLELIRDTDRPLFVHVHMMGTHGARFNPEQQVFSSGETQDKDWMTDFYDDGILNFDRYIGEVLDTLKETGKLDNTIIVIYSDHAMRYDVRIRIPLIVHFPGNQYAGRIQNGVQNLDIAPTILDYLGLPIPKWMEGRSLLLGDPPAHRLIFSGGTSASFLDTEKWILDAARVKPPFFQFSYLNVVDCNHWYQLDLILSKWTTGKVAGHTSPCDENSMLTIDQARAELARLLASDGFDVSTLP